MIKSRTELIQRGIEVDLSGPQGNAFYLMGLADTLAKKLNKDTDAIRAEMKAGNYDHLIEVFEREFGEYVTLYRNEPDDDDDE